MNLTRRNRGPVSPKVQEEMCKAGLPRRRGYTTTHSEWTVLHRINIFAGNMERDSAKEDIEEYLVELRWSQTNSCVFA